MTAAPHRARLDRVRASIEALSRREGSQPDADGIRFVHQVDMRAGRYTVRAGAAGAIPAEVLEGISTMIGDLRSALDEAATLAAGAPVKFPIHESLPMFAQRARKAISRMPDEAQAAIEALQPYHAIGGYRNGLLWILDQLSATPLRLAAGAIPPRAGAGGPALGVNTQRKVQLVGEPELVEGAFEAGAVVASQQFRIVGPDPKLDMYFRAPVALAFAADGPARGRGVVELVGAIADHLELNVFPALERPLGG